MDNPQPSPNHRYDKMNGCCSETKCRWTGEKIIISQRKFKL